MTKTPQYPIPSVSLPTLLYPPLLLAACLLLALGLLLAAARRADRQRLLVRLLASALAPLALWLTAYPPTRAVRATGGAVLVLTPGYSPDTLRVLRQRLGPGTPTWAYGVPAPAGARPLGSLLALAEQRPALRQMHLLGAGVAAAALPALGEVPVVAHLGRSFVGIATADWSRQLTLGQQFWVEGQVSAASVDGPTWLNLWADGAGRDSVRLPVGGGPFRLRYRPRAAGLAGYELRLRPAVGPLLAREPLPIEITEPARPPVLLLAAAPGFELKFLKNSLAATGRAVAARTGLSKGLMASEFLNHPAQVLDRLTPAALARYGVVVADADALVALPATDARALAAALRQGRLGLLVLADASAARPGSSLPTVLGRARAAFMVRARVGAAATLAQPLSWADAPGPAKARLPAELRPAPGWRSLLTGPGGVLLAASQRVGLGTVVVSVMPETFPLALSGQTAVYASLWSALLTAAQPPPPAAPTWQLLTAWPRPGQPLTLRLVGGMVRPADQADQDNQADQADQVPPVVRGLSRPLFDSQGPSARLGLAQDPRLPEWRTAPYWPAVSGWHEVRGPGVAVRHFYVFDSAAWAGPEQTVRQQALAARAARLRQGVASRSDALETVRQPWPVGWFFGLFLLAAGFLWLEEKL